MADAIYGLAALAANPDRPVLIVQTDAIRVAAQQLVPNSHVVVAGDANSDWNPVYGRTAYIWPVAGPSYMDDALAIAHVLAPHRGQSKLVLHDQDDMPDGWSLEQALADGWTTKQVAAHLKRKDKSHQHVIKTQLDIARITLRGHNLQIGAPHDGEPAIDAVRGIDVPPAERSISQWWDALMLQRNNGGIPYPTEANAVRILSGHDQFQGRIWLNEFSQRLMMDDHVVTDTDEVGAMIAMQQYLDMHKISMLSIQRAMLIIGQTNKRHPIKAWLDGLTWDSEPRLDTLLTRAFGADDNEYIRAVGRCWLISLVARVYEPGCQVDTLPVFEGPQGVYKSTAMRTLGGEWFIESHADPIHENKAFMETVQGHWLIEIPEMHSIVGRGAGIEKIKGIISNRVDSYRVPYDRHPKQFPRQCVFAGTTNANAYLPDPTGARRFWPVECGKIDIPWIAANRDQLFAEAVTQYRAKHCWWDLPQDAAREQQESRRERDAWEDLILTYMQSRSGRDVTQADILENCLQIDPGKWTQNDQNRVGRALRANGYFRTRVRIDSIRTWVYRKSVTLAKSLDLPMTSEHGEDDF